MKPDVETINLMIDIAELGATQALIKRGDLSPYISFREAARLYGAAIVRRWHKEGLIKFLQDKVGGKIRIDRLRLEVVAKDSNRGR